MAMNFGLVEPIRVGPSFFQNELIWIKPKRVQVGFLKENSGLTSAQSLKKFLRPDSGKQVVWHNFSPNWRCCQSHTLISKMVLPGQLNIITINCHSSFFPKTCLVKKKHDSYFTIMGLAGKASVI